jgi:hypothetical protein
VWEEPGVDLEQGVLWGTYGAYRFVVEGPVEPEVPPGGVYELLTDWLRHRPDWVDGNRVVHLGVGRRLPEDIEDERRWAAQLPGWQAAWQQALEVVWRDVVATLPGEVPQASVGIQAEQELWSGPPPGQVREGMWVTVTEGPVEFVSVPLRYPYLVVRWDSRFWRSLPIPEPDLMSRVVDLADIVQEGVIEEVHGHGRHARCTGMVSQGRGWMLHTLMVLCACANRQTDFAACGPDKVEQRSHSHPGTGPTSSGSESSVSGMRPC